MQLGDISVDALIDLTVIQVTHALATVKNDISTTYSRSHNNVRCKAIWICQKMTGKENSLRIHRSFKSIKFIPSTCSLLKSASSCLSIRKYGEVSVLFYCVSVLSALQILEYCFYKLRLQLTKTQHRIGFICIKFFTGDVRPHA